MCKENCTDCNNCMNAKTSGFNFSSFGTPSFNSGGYGGSAFNWNSLINSYGPDSGSGGTDELDAISQCIAAGLPYPCNTSGNNTPVYLPPSQPTQPPRTSSGDSGLSWLDKILALSPTIINAVRGNNQQYPINQQPLILPNPNPNPSGGALENVGNTFLNTIASNPLIVLLIIGGGVLLFMPSPRSRNGTLRLIPNPSRKRRTKKRRR